MFYYVTSLFQQINDVRIFERKSRHGNLYMLHSGLFIAQIWHLIQSLFHLVLEPVSEDFDARRVVLLALVRLVANERQVLFYQEIIEKRRLNVKLDCIISRCHCLDIPLYIDIFLYFFHVIQVDHDKKCDENCPTAHKKLLNLSFL